VTLRRTQGRPFGFPPGKKSAKNQAKNQKCRRADIFAGMTGMEVSAEESFG
jgi:hypothetical protein